MRPAFVFVVAVGLIASARAFGCDKPIGPEDFCGTYRADAKTSYYKGHDEQIAPFEKYADLRALLAALPSDQDMRAQADWSLDAAPTSRLEAEDHNVEVKAYVVAVKPGEADRDLHVIVSDGPSGTGKVFMNVEVSGLPVNHVDQSDFERARSQIRGLVPEVDHEAGRYIRLSGTKVVIQGSLFFDGDHHAGCSSCPGPAYAKPKTVWEIHPLYSITVP